jgi:hypothetical protein
MKNLAEMVREVENVFARALKAIPEADLLAYFAALSVTEHKRAAVLREYHAHRGAVARPLPLITPPPARRRTRAQRLNAGFSSYGHCMQDLLCNLSTWIAALLPALVCRS